MKALYSVAIALCLLTVGACLGVFATLMYDRSEADPSSLITQRIAIEDSLQVVYADSLATLDSMRVVLSDSVAVLAGQVAAAKRVATDARRAGYTALQRLSVAEARLLNLSPDADATPDSLAVRLVRAAARLRPN